MSIDYSKMQRQFAKYQYQGNSPVMKKVPNQTLEIDNYQNYQKNNFKNLFPDQSEKSEEKDNRLLNYSTNKKDPSNFYNYLKLQQMFPKQQSSQTKNMSFDNNAFLQNKIKELANKSGHKRNPTQIDQSEKNTQLKLDELLKKNDSSDKVPMKDNFFKEKNKGLQQSHGNFQSLKNCFQMSESFTSTNKNYQNNNNNQQQIFKLEEKLNHKRFLLKKSYNDLTEKNDQIQKMQQIIKNSYSSEGVNELFKVLSKNQIFAEYISLINMESSQRQSEQNYQQHLHKIKENLHNFQKQIDQQNNIQKSFQIQLFQIKSSLLEDQNQNFIQNVRSEELVTDIQESIQDLINLNKIVKQNNSQLQKQINQLQNEKKDLQQRIDFCEQMVTQRGGSIGQINSQQQVFEENESLKHDFVCLAQQLKFMINIDDDDYSMEEILQKIQEKLNQKTDNQLLNEIQYKFESAKKKNESYEDKLKFYEEKCDIYESQVNELKLKKQQIQQQYDTTQNQLQEQIDLVVLFQNQKNCMQEQLENQQQNKSLEQEYEFENKYLMSQQYIQQLQQQIQLIEKDLEFQQEKTLDQQKTIENLRNQVKQEILEREQIINDNKTDLLQQQSQEQINNLQSELRSLKSQNQIKEDNIQQHESQIKNLKQQLQQKTSEISEINLANQKYQTMNDSKQQNISQIQQEFNKSKQIFLKQQQEQNLKVDDLSLKLQNKTQQFEKLQDQFNNLQYQIEAENLKNEQVNTQIRSLKNDLTMKQSNYQQKINDLQEEVFDKDSIIEEKRVRINNLENDIQEKMDEIDELKQQIDNYDNSNGQTDLLEEQNIEIQKKNKEFKQIIENLQLKISEQNDQILKLQVLSDRQLQTEDITGYQQTIKENEKRINDLEQKIQQLQALNIVENTNENELIDKQETIDQLTQELQEYQTITNKEIEQLKQKIMELEKSKLEKTKENSSSEKSDKKKETKEDIDDDTQVLKEQLKMIQNQLAESNQTHEKFKIKSRDEIRMRTVLEGMLDQYFGIKSKVKLTQDIIDSLPEAQRNQISNYSDELDKLKSASKSVGKNKNLAKISEKDLAFEENSEIDEYTHYSNQLTQYDQKTQDFVKSILKDLNKYKKYQEYLEISQEVGKDYNKLKETFKEQALNQIKNLLFQFFKFAVAEEKLQVNATLTTIFSMLEANDSEIEILLTQLCKARSIEKKNFYSVLFCKK